MVGPVQRVVYDLKARFNGDKALVRRELLRRGYGQPAAPGVRPIPSSKPAAARQAELPGPAEHEKRHDTPDIELTRNE